LRYKILVFTFEGQAKNTIIDIEWKYLSKISLKYVIFRSHFWQKLGIFPKWELWIKHLTLACWYQSLVSRIVRRMPSYFFSRVDLISYNQRVSGRGHGCVDSAPASRIEGWLVVWAADLTWKFVQEKISWARSFETLIDKRLQANYKYLSYGFTL
jgi:hypothetical protein